MYVTLYTYVTDIVYTQTVAYVVYTHVCIHYICMSQTVALNHDIYMCRLDRLCQVPLVALGTQCDGTT